MNSKNSNDHNKMHVYLMSREHTLCLFYGGIKLSEWKKKNDLKNILNSLYYVAKVILKLFVCNNYFI